VTCRNFKAIAKNAGINRKPGELKAYYTSNRERLSLDIAVSLHHQQNGGQPLMVRFCSTSCSY